MKKKIAVLSSRKIRMLSHMLLSMGDIMLRIAPSLGTELRQSGIDKEYSISSREYLAVCFTTGLITAVVIGLVVTLVLSSGTGEFTKYGPFIGLFAGFLNFIQLVSYPRVIVGKRIKNLERNLLFALRTILVQIRSGVPIFDSFVSIATGNYGEVSNEFRIVIEKTRSGKSVVDSLEELADRNPSIFFRRAIWQMANAMKSGSDIGENLESVIESLSKEQLVQIREYKSILNPLAMMYMMIAVIIPSLGITVMIIISTFPGMESLGDETTFWGMLAGVVVMQFFFMNIMKSKRPNLAG